MSTNGVNVEDTDMAECDGEKVVTMMDVLQEQQEFEEDANAVLGASDAKNCTYSEGYIKRQAIYACLTCCADAKEDPAKRAGVCLACSLACHENHDLVELYTKRNFRCDCGNPKFNHPCQYTQNKTDLNNENSYNQNFSGLYCICHRPYPDPEGIEEEMIQCIVCEDWLHASHLEATVPSSDLYAEMVCKSCMGKNEFLHAYSNYAVNGDVDVCMNESDSSLICNGDTTENGVHEAGKGDCKGLEVDSELNEVKTESVKSSEMEKLEKNVINPEERISSLSNNVDIKPEEQTEPKTSVSENNDGGKAIETETALNNASENVNDVKNEVPGDKDLSQKQDSASVTEPKNVEGSSDVLSESKEVLTADKIDDSTGSAEGNISNLTNNAEVSANIAESISDIPENAQETNNIDAENMAEVTGNAEDSSKVADDVADIIENAQASNNVDVDNNKAEDKIADNNKNIAEVSTNAEDSTKVADDVAGITEIAQASNNADVENMAEVSTNAEDSTKVADDVADITENVEKLTNTDLENTANVSDIAKDSTEGDTKNIASDSKEEKSDEKITDNPPLSTIVDAAAMETSESILKEDEAGTKTNDNVTKNTENGLELVDNQIGSQHTSQHVDHSEDHDEKMEQNTNITENNSTSATEDQTVENKRKHLTEETEDDVSVKKPKLGETCVKPKSRRKVFKGATFWPSHFRQKLCTCNECITMYKDLSVLFLTDLEDTVTAYEALGKERTDGTASTQYEQGLEALSSLGRIQQINALTEYNKMRDKLLDFLKSFKDRKEVVKEEDIKAFFAGMKPKREPDGVYFCR